MAAPTIRGTPTAGNSGGNVTSQTIPLPFSDFNDLVVVFVAIDGIVSPTESSGRWSIQTITSSSVTHALCTARQDNSLPDLSLTLVPGANEALSWVAYAVQDTPDYQTDRSSFGSDANPDADSISDGPAHDYLVLSAAAWNGNKSLVSYPTGYSLGQATDRWANANGVGIAAAGREALATAVEDPDPFAISAADDWAAWTVGLTVHVFVTTINPIGISSDALPGVAGLTRGRLIYPAIGVASSEAVGTSRLVPVARILPTGIATGQVLGNPIRLGGRSIAPSGIASAETFGTPRLFIEYGSAVISDSPSAWWRLDEPSGNFIDEINGLIGTPTGAPTRSVTSPIRSEPNDKAITVSAAQYISIPSNTALDLANGPLTIEAWIFLTAYPVSPNSGAIVGKGTNGYLFWVDSTGKLYLSKRFVDDVLTSTGAPIALNTWYHVVAVHNVSVLNKLYVNNVDTPLTFKSTVLLADTVSALGITSEIGGTASGQFTGTIDEVALYKSTLSAARVAAHYNAGIRSRILANGVVSGELVGNPTLTGLYNLLVSGIDSGEIVGNPTLLGLVTLLAIAIDSGEAVGSHIVSLVSAITAIIANGIASGEAIGSATLTTLATILTNAINSAESIGTHQLYPTNQILVNQIDGYRTEVLDDSPSVYWRLDETSGNFIDEVSALPATVAAGTVTRGVTSPIISEAADTAVALDGTAARITSPSNAALDLGAGPFSVEIWFKRSAPMGVVQALIAKGTGAYLVSLTAADGLRLRVEATGNVMSMTGAGITDTAWHHAVMVWTGVEATSHIYLDSVDRPYTFTPALTFTDSVSALTIGSDVGGGTSYFPGSVDEVALYKSALSADRVSAHYNAGLGRDRVGTPAFYALATILANGITSAEALGNPTLALAAFAATILANGVASGELIGTPTLAAIATILANGVASAEAAGSATLLKGGVLVLPSGVAGAGALGSAILLPGGVQVNPSGVLTGEVVSLPVVGHGGVLVVPSGVASSEAFGAHILTSLVAVRPTGISSAEALGLHILSPGGVNIQTTGVPSAESVGSHALTTIANIIVQAIASGEAISTPIVLAGGVTVQVTAVASAEALGTHTLRPGGVQIIASGVTSQEIFGSHVINTGELRIFVNAIASTELFGTPTLTTLAQILASGITSGQAVGNPTFLALASIITSGISSGEAIGLHTLRAVANILPQGVTTSEVVGLPTLASVATIIAQAIQSGELIGSHLITGQLIGYTIAPSGVAGAETFGLPVVQPGPVRILVQQVGSSEAFGAVNLRAVNVVIPPGVGSAEALGLNTITPGGVQIIVAGVPGGEIVAEPILRGAWTITPTGVTSDEALGSTVLLTGYFVRPSSIPGEEAFGLPELQPGEVFVEVVSIDSGEVIGHARVNVGALRTAIQFAYGKGFADTRRRSWPTARDTGDTRTRDWTTAQKKPTATRRH